MGIYVKKTSIQCHLNRYSKNPRISQPCQRQRKDPRVLDEKLATADLKVDGKVLDDKEKLMIFIGVGSRSSKKIQEGVMLVGDPVNKR